MSRLSMKDIKERREVVRAVVEPMLTSKRHGTVSTIYERCKPALDGRLRTVLSVDTASLRLSSSESPLFPESTNQQNMPKKVAKFDPMYKVRDIYIAAPGYTLLAADYRGAEALLVFAYSQDWKWVEKLLASEDIHLQHGQLFFHRETPNLVAPLERDVAKTLTYASFYYAKLMTLTQHLNRDSDFTGRIFTQTEVKEMFDTLLQEHTLQQWWELTRQELEENDGALRNCFGYRRVFHSPAEDKRLKDGLSFYPQSTVGWLMNENLTHSHRLWPERVLLQIHDELLWMVREEEVEEHVRRFKPYMERRFTIHGRELYIPTDWKIGSPWGQMKELKL